MLKWLPLESPDFLLSYNELKARSIGRPFVPRSGGDVEAAKAVWADSDTAGGAGSGGPSRQQGLVKVHVMESLTG